MIMKKIFFVSDWGKKPIMMRSFHLIPSISIIMYKDWKFESIRISWLGFLVVFYRELGTYEN